MVGLGALTIVSCLAVVAAFTVNRAGSAQAVDNMPSAGATATATAPETTTGQGGETGAAKTELQAKLSTALQATSWPQLDTDPGDPKGPQLDPRFDECSSFKYKRESCTFGDPAAPKTAVLVGDSIAAAYLPGLAEVFGQGEWKLETAALYACPFIDLRLGDRAAAADACEKRRDAEVELVTSTNPDLVIVANTYLRNKTLDTGKSATLNEWQTAFDAQLTKLNGSYKSITVLPPPPYGASVETCYSPPAPGRRSARRRSRAPTTRGR
ncbi:SGNH hydrolase domain-containing protein [Leifsonia xyli]|nr:SGNH hydrolase domain-containing protein [Leifsonia xyli]